MSDVNHRARRGGPYQAPGLLPAAGQERTFALLIAGIPLLLILLINFLPSLTSAKAGSGASGTEGWPYSTPFTGQSTDDSDDDSTDGGLPSAPDTSTEDDTSLWGPTDPAGSTGSADPSESTDATEGTDPTESPAIGRQSADPGTTVTRYFEAINARDFETAWELGGKNLGGDYSSFKAGFADTERDVVTVNSVDGTTVSVDLRAELTNGTEQLFSGTYTVVDGVITDASMTRTG
ncbi:hypothetical protein ABZ614_26555 [Streptomyces sp. NPDC013178]|uniref:hypothetical protein n=1 Tax=Streptomyces sp. NPDC013178 TaxID=3155118 RepID=UPI003406614E